jgi:hypothetical protein
MAKPENVHGASASFPTVALIDPRDIDGQALGKGHANSAMCSLAPNMRENIRYERSSLWTVAE